MRSFTAFSRTPSWSSPADEPKSWLDLTDPRWKGKILSDDFRALGGGGVLFSVLEDQFGRDFQEKLAQAGSEVQPRDSGERTPCRARRVSRSIFPESLTSVPELKGLPVKFLAPKEGLPYVGYDLALSRMHRTRTRHAC